MSVHGFMPDCCTKKLYAQELFFFEYRIHSRHTEAFVSALSNVALGWALVEGMSDLDVDVRG